MSCFFLSSLNSLNSSIKCLIALLNSEPYVDLGNSHWHFCGTSRCWGEYMGSTFHIIDIFVMIYGYIYFVSSKSDVDRADRAEERICTRVGPRF